MTTTEKADRARESARRQREAAIARHLPDGLHELSAHAFSSMADVRPVCSVCGDPLDSVLAPSGRHLLCKEQP